jgi:uncharacterized protein with LGFP repeats
MLNPSIATNHHRTIKLLAAMVIAGLFFAALPGRHASAAPASSSQLFSATGHTVSGAFLDAYYRLGGLPIIGYPITEPVIENGYQVQYFERERFEYHPEHAGTPYEVLLSRLGYELSKPLQPFAAGKSGGTGVFFAQTSHSLSGEFLRYWQDKGGLSVFGYPISEPFSQNGIITQYFERARFEYHPEAPDPYKVQLGLIGQEIHGVEGRTSPAAGLRYFQETGHGVPDKFMQYWLNNNGLAVFGYPISEPRNEVSPTDGKTYAVQYFQRARFEYHPELPPGQDVLLGLLGKQLYQQKHPTR